LIETTETPAAATTEAAAEPAAEEAQKEEPKAEEPKVNRRTSKLGDFFKKVTSPTHEKKEAEVVPAQAPVVNEPEAPAAESSEAPAAAAEEATDKPAEKAADATTPTKEKKKFFDVGKLFPKEKAKTPTAEEAPKIEETPAAAETAVAEPVAEATEAPIAAETPAVNGETKAAEPKDKRRSSFFTGSFVKKLGHKEEKTEAATDAEAPKAEEATPAETEAPKAAEPEKKKEHKENPLAKLGRRVSTAVRGGNKKEKEASSPAKVEETGEASTSEAPKIEEPAKEEEKKEEPKQETPAAQAIGDVVAEAVNIGSAPPAGSTVQAAA
jgi:hypothetical protein